MKTALSTVQLLQPRTLAEALRMLRDEEHATPLAGATDLYVALNFGTLPAPRFVNLWGLGSLARITMQGDTLSIGACATYSDIMRSRHVRKRLPILVQAAGEIGGVQIQNRGTIGGNIANASPAGDSLPVLAVAEAVIVLKSANDERRVPFTGFYTGYRESVRRPDELIVAVEIPPLDGVQWFRKVGTRAAQAISKVVMAAIRAPEPRIAIGSVAPTVIRLPRTEAILAGGGSLDRAVQALGEEVHPIDDLRSSARYRKNVASNLLRRFWSDTSTG